eukprot:TRINITY_DN9421_c0_g1_i2.p1 TRINITY_DN9421_c0_g1~~TRINITY_DN9421_c0_g1_i2.p1  ORF type:complete len:257 (+),score=33.70 TRINITY_DN9421_c0_g1_i2:51-821(+)
MSFERASSHSLGNLTESGRPQSRPSSAAGQPKPNNCGRDPHQKVSEGRFFHTRFHIAYEEVAKARNLHKLELLFHQTDFDGSGELSLEEFRLALKGEELRTAFASLGIQPHQCERVFQFLDKDRSGEITIEEFMGGLKDIVDTSVDGTGKELDLALLQRKGKQPRRQSNSGLNVQEPIRLKSELQSQMRIRPGLTRVASQPILRPSSRPQAGCSLNARPSGALERPLSAGGLIDRTRVKKFVSNPENLKSLGLLVI